MNDLPADLTMPKPVRFTAAEFVRMNEAGVFERFAKTELIDGEVLSMNAQHRRHSRVKNDLVERMRIVLRRIAPDLSALSEVSVDLSPGNVPEPDIVILEDDGGDDLAPASRVRLVVEVADTSLAVDLGRKARMYADAGIAEYWVVDVAGRHVVRHVDPRDGGYGTIDTIAFGDPITAATIPGLMIETTRL